MEKSNVNTAIIVAVIAGVASIIVALINNNSSNETPLPTQRDRVETPIESTATIDSNYANESAGTHKSPVRTPKPTGEIDAKGETDYGLTVSFVDEKNLAPIKGVGIRSVEGGFSMTSNRNGEVEIPKSVVDKIGQYGAVSCFVSHNDYKGEKMVVSLSENQTFKLQPK